MRFLLLLLALIFISTESSMKNDRDLVFYKLEMGHSLTIDGISFHFESVASDSRCPIDVICIQAGEALVNVKISKEREEVSKTVLTFTPTVFMPSNIYKDENLIISAVDLSPYPIAGRDIDLMAYVLKLSIEKNN